MTVDPQIEELLSSALRPDPWTTELGNIPWNDPGFSRRMLAEHLNQAHDGASRNFAAIARQVAWIHDALLGGECTRILDLGCGPGLYTERLAALGHECTGIDFGPASIEFAKDVAARDGLACSYIHGDLRSAAFGTNHGLAMFLFGEPSVFAPDVFRGLLRRIAASIREGGLLLLEPHTPAGVRAVADQADHTKKVDAGLFLDAPHHLRTEASFDPLAEVGVRRYLVTPGPEHPVEVHSVWYQSYEDDRLRTILGESGFDPTSIVFHPNLVDRGPSAALQFVTAQRA